MKKFLLYVAGVYIFFASLYALNDYLRVPKNIYQISNITKGLPEKVRIIDIERDYDISRDNNFFVLADNNHIYQIDPIKRTVVKDIKVNGLSNPNGFSIVRFYNQKKYLYEIYIADTNNSRIVKLELPLNNNDIVVQTSTLIAIKNEKPIDVSFYKKYHENGYHHSDNIAVFTDKNKIKSFNIESKQLNKSFDLMLSVNKQIIPFKNLPYYRDSLISNWGTGPQLKRDDYLEIIENNKIISRADISCNLGKISKSMFYTIPDNDNKLIWISSPSSHADFTGKIIRGSMMYRTIKYKKDINIAIRYGDHRYEKLFIVAYKNEYGLSYNKIEYGIIGKLLSISETIFHILITPFVMLAYLGR